MLSSSISSEASSTNSSPLAIRTCTTASASAHRWESGDVTHVIVTPRLDGLWDRWSEDVLAEAARIGATADATTLKVINVQSVG
jgi:hypothetical protein